MPDPQTADAVLFALLLSAVAGLSTGFGSAIALFARRTNTRFLGASLGFSGGVMIYISFVELLPDAAETIGAGGDRDGELWATLGFFAGALLTLLIDRLVPESDNPHDAALVEDLRRPEGEWPSLHRIGVLTALVIGLHNFPEGIATFFSALDDPTRGLAVAVAIALHNVPEGISVSVPVYYATGSRTKAFWLSFSSGLAEPVGALCAWLILGPFLTPLLTGLVNAAVAGVMVFLALDQLVPNAKRYDPGHLPVYGLLAGMGVMAVTLLWS